MLWAVFLSLLISGSAPSLVFNAMGLTELDFSHNDHHGQRTTVSSCAGGELGLWEVDSPAQVAQLNRGWTPSLKSRPLSKKS